MRPPNFSWLIGGILLVLTACSGEKLPAGTPLSLAEACQSVLGHFGKLDGFRLKERLDAELAGHPAVRMEAGWKKDGQDFRGIIYVVEQPAWFNVIYYAAPEVNGLFEHGLPAFQKIMRSLRPWETPGGFEVLERDGQNVLRSGELRLEFLLPADWIYTLDTEKRALVLSGPRRERDWLTTVNLSVVHKWPQS